MQSRLEKMREQFKCAETILADKVCQSREGQQVLVELATSGFIPENTSTKLKEHLSPIEYFLSNKDDAIKRPTRMAVNLALIANNKLSGQSIISFGNELAEILREHILNNDDQFTRLNLNFRALGISHLDAIQLEALCAVVKDLKISYKVSFNIFCEQAIPILAAIKESHITALDVSGYHYFHELNDRNLQALCDTLKNSGLLSVDFDNTYFSPAQFIAICAAIKPSNLTHINLPTTGLGYLTDDAFDALCDAISNSKLTWVNLSYNKGLNEIDSVKFKKLCAAVEQNLSLLWVGTKFAKLLPNNRGATIEDFHELDEAIRPTLERNKLLFESTQSFTELQNALKDSTLTLQEKINFIETHKDRLTQARSLFQKQIDRFESDKPNIPVNTALFLKEYLTKFHRNEYQFLHEAGRWLLQQNEYEKALQCLLAISSDNPAFNNLRFEAFEASYMTRLNDLLSEEKPDPNIHLNQTPAIRNALMDSLPFCLNDEGAFITMSDNHITIFNNILARAAGIEHELGQHDSLTDENQLTLLQFALLRSLGLASLSFNTDRTNILVRNKQLTHIYNLSMKLPLIATYADVEANKKQINELWKETHDVINPTNDLHDKNQIALFEAVTKRLPPPVQKKMAGEELTLHAPLSRLFNTVSSAASASIQAKNTQPSRKPS